MSATGRKRTLVSGRREPVPVTRHQMEQAHISQGTRPMIFKAATIAAALIGAAAPATGAAAPTDPQIAHIVYTADNIDIAAGKQARALSHNSAVRAFAEEMIRDHSAVNDKALALAKK